ncbi:MAG: efflux RND transporter permease subunit [Verrucomicrobia bacterium]|nr:efflux RND transporter permease subunit [Verrucomicrobiota bacterium]
MNVSQPFIKRPVMTYIIMAVILLMGLIAFKKLPVTDLPNVDYPVIMVQTSYAGASPEVMARTVTTPLEKELININGVKHVTSQSNRGFSWITILFELNRNLDEAAQDVQAALKRAEHALPRDLDQSPTYSKANAHQESIIYLVLTSGSSTLSDLYDYAHTRIEQRVARIEGVGKVEVHGSPYALRIQVNPELMAARGLTFDEVRSAVAGSTGNLPLGVLETAGRKFTLDVPGQLKSAAEFRNLLLKDNVRLKEIADVFDGLESDEVFHLINKDEDKLAVILGIKKQSGANAVKISEELKRVIPEIQAELPPSMHIEVWFDKASWIKEAIEDVEWSLIISFALVVGVIFFSLRRFRETMIAATALPLSVIGTFIVMYFLGFNIDILSLLALTLAMGFVIDDAIVVLENIVRHQEKGLSPMQAALTGSKEIGFTILSMTLSLVAVFIPLLFMKDVTGMLFREFSVTLAVSILVSGFVSLTLTPMLCSKFASDHKQTKTVLNSSMLGFYRRSLDWCMRHRKTTLGGAFACATLAVLLFRFLPINLFPEEDRGFIWSFVQMPSGMSKKDSEEYQRKLNSIVQTNPAVETFVTLNFKDYFIYLISLHEADKRPAQNLVVGELQTKFNGVPGTQAFMRGMQLVSNQGGGFSRNNYQFVLKGTDIEEVKTAATALKHKLLANPAFINPDISIKADDPKLEVNVYEEQIEKLGVTRQMIQTLLQNAYSGGHIGKIQKGGEEYHVFLELDPRFQKSTAALAKLYLKTPSGTSVPLKSVAAWKEGVGLQSIEHLDLLSSITLSFDIAKDAPLSEMLELLKKTSAETLPSSVSGKLEGVAEMVDKTSSDTVLLLLLAVVAMYAVLAILYESFIHPVTILSSMPFACLGGILTLLVFREALSLYSMVGFLLLIGIVKKNGIMMIDCALDLQRNQNLPPYAAIQEACMIRFRPIMMTTVAAVMGALPIAIGIGAGSETRRGLGLVIAGGLIFSQFLTLYITPIIFLYLEKLRNKRSKAQMTS